MGLIDDIKNDVKKSGTNKKKIVYFKSGTKVRVRFLQELDDGLKVLFHDSYSAGVNEPCQEIFGRDCPHHDDEDLRHGNMYMWSVWDYEAKEVKILMGRVNNCSPIPLIMGFYDTYGTVMDRDYVITKNGSGTNQTWAVVPMDKVKFKNGKAKPFSESKVYSILDKAYPAEGSEDEDEEDEAPRRKNSSKKNKPTKTNSKKKQEEEDEEYEEDEEEMEEIEEAQDEYDSMSPKELYQLCKKRGLKVEPKKSGAFYIKKLQENDEAEADWEEDSWDEE